MGSSILTQIGQIFMLDGRCAHQYPSSISTHKGPCSRPAMFAPPIQLTLLGRRPVTWGDVPKYSRDQSPNIAAGGFEPRPKGLRGRNSPTCTLSQNGYGTRRSGQKGRTNIPPSKPNDTCGIRTHAGRPHRLSRPTP